MSKIRRYTGAFASTMFLVLGACTSPPATCSGSISWEEAESHVGEEATVEGPVVSTRYAYESEGAPTFLNIGRTFPDPERFTVVIWEDDRDNFDFSPESEYDGETLCVSGVVNSYEGVPQIEVSVPDQLEVR